MRQGIGPNTEDVVQYIGESQAHAKRGTSTTYNTYKNVYALQSVNGGPETVNLNAPT